MKNDSSIRTSDGGLTRLPLNSQPNWKPGFSIHSAATGESWGRTTSRYAPSSATRFEYDAPRGITSRAWLMTDVKDAVVSLARIQAAR